MKVSEFIDDDDRYNANQTDEDILYEMANFNSRTTGLPPNIEVWTRTDPLDHGHDKYRIKITKNKEWVGIFSVGENPTMRENVNNSLSVGEQNEILQWIKEFFPLIVSHIDGKIDSGEFSLEVQKIRGSK